MRETDGAHHRRETDDVPRRTDPRKRLVAVVLVACLVLTMAPFVASLFF